jgi:hypothetical protein
MQPLKNFNPMTTNELAVVKTSFLKSIYDITDGSHSYARLSDPDKFIGTLINSWTFERDANLPGELAKMLIKDGKGNSVGFFTFDAGTKNLLLEMNNGFKAELVKTHYFLGLKSDYVWRNTNTGDIMTLKESLWSGKKPVKVIFNTPLNRQSTEMELMLLYGVGYSLITRFHQVSLPLGLL